MADRQGQASEAVRLQKFQNPAITAGGAPRATVALRQLETLWIITGTLCNIECAHCYIESSPTNGRLSYITLSEAMPFLDDAAAMGAREIGFTGGEPFMNPDMPALTEAALAQEFDVLILTNAMRPMMRPAIQDALVSLNKKYADKLRLRISVDHFNPALHDEERGAGAFEKTMRGMAWLQENGFSLSVAARLRWGGDEAAMRKGFCNLFAREEFSLDADDPHELILFPEMDETADTPEITTACWSILGKSPDQVMCSSSRMLVKRKGAEKPAIIACTLLPYEPAFELGGSLAEADVAVPLNHPHCAKFCVLGGASCSG